MSREMKYSGNPWIGEIPCSWNVERIKTIFKERTELSEDGSETLLSVSEHYGVANRSEKVSEGDFVSRAETLVGYKKCFVGDLVSNIMLAWKGSMGITEIDGIVSPAYCVYQPSAAIHPKYYHYLFRTPLYTSIFRLYSKGIIDSRLRLYSPYFFDISAIIPPLSEQRMIASFLDRKCTEIDRVIALQEKFIEELKAYKQSVISEAVTKGLNADAPMRDSGIEWIGQIPEHWRVMPHKRVMRKVKEIQEYYNGENILSLTMKGVIVRDLDAGGKMPATFDGYQRVYPNNLLQCLFDIDVTPRCVGLIKEYGLTSPAYSQFEFFANAYSPYYDYLLRYMDDIKAMLHLSKNLRSSLTETDFGAILTCVPPICEQKAIAEYLDKKCTEIDSLISIKLSKIDSLKEYKKSIIYEYVTGKKEVTE